MLSSTRHFIFSLYSGQYTSYTVPNYRLYSTQSTLYPLHGYYGVGRAYMSCIHHVRTALLPALLAGWNVNCAAALLVYSALFGGGGC